MPGMESDGGAQAPSNELIGHRIWRLMTQRGLSAAGLGRRMDVSRQAVSQWTNGDHLPKDASRINQLARELGVTVDDLYGPSADETAELDWIARLRAVRGEGQAARALQLLATIDPDRLVEILEKASD